MKKVFEELFYDFSRFSLKRNKFHGKKIEDYYEDKKLI